MSDKDTVILPVVASSENRNGAVTAAYDSSSFWKRFTVGNTGASAENQMKRAMQSRHLTMIGDAGSAIALAGPGGALLSYFVVGIFVYCVVITLGEMSAMYPVSGAFSVFGTKFVSPALGFTLGWTYWFEWYICLLVNLFLVLIFLILLSLSYRTIGIRESEYWFSLIKVLMIILFIFVGLIYDWGGVRGHPGPGLSNFQNGQAFIGGFENFAQTFVYAFYSFAGVELVAVAAGESVQPHKTVPRAVKATFFRIQDPTLISTASSSDVAASPLTVVFQRTGFGAAVHVVNAVLLTAVISATNSCFYASSRMLLSLARSGQAPRVFGWVNSRGVPIPTLLMALAVSFLTFLTSIWGEGIVFTWLLNLSGISALLVWGSIGLISLRFRVAYRAQGRSLSDLPYTQPLYPLLPIGVVVVLSTSMFIAEGYSAVEEEPFEAKNVAATYIGIILYVALYIGYTMYERFRLGIRQHFVPLLEVDFETDAVWKPGEGAMIQDQDQYEGKNEEDAAVPGTPRWQNRQFSVAKRVY
ncbi:hypothetical protein M405DRAFT_809739 [Rhizopogon salebrosus TDB-379]|nr:hypothetical protein M405DRAFT_809739 [Rhizopogon salebrosus TDB-379]